MPAGVATAWPTCLAGGPAHDRQSVTFDRDIILPLFSIALVGGYEIVLAIRERANPDHRFQSMLNKARRAWVDRMMEGQEGILAVQTLRNAIMGATFFASTAVALIVGTITLSTQGDRLSQIWTSATDVGAIDQHLWLVKLMALLIDMMCAFVFFAQAIRLNAHVGVLIGVPTSHISPDVVADVFIRAGRFQTRGMRCYYLATPLVFWLFGPVLLLVASCALVGVLHVLDRSPLQSGVNAARA